MTNWALWGTLVNTVAVLFGAFAGLAIKAIASRVSKTAEKNVELLQDGEAGKTSRFAELPSTVQKGLGLCVLLIGILGAVKVQNMLVMIVSLVLGAIVGVLLDLDGQINRLGAFVEKKMKGKGGNVAEGFVTATLLFCVGAMTVTGAIESSVHHTHSTYYAKAMIDMVAAVIFGSAYGLGVVLSAGAVFVTQGALTLLASLLAGAIPMAIINEMIAVGSLLLVAIGLNQMGVTRIRVMNLLPAMFLPILLVPLFGLLPA